MDTTFDYMEREETNLPTKEEVLQNEEEMLLGLLEAANFKQDTSLQKKIEIKRSGKVLFSFFVRPLTEEELQGCRKRVTMRKFFRHIGENHFIFSYQSFSCV